MSGATAAPGGPPAAAWGGSRTGKRIARNLARVLPVRLWGRLMPRPVIGLCYHVVSDRSLPHVRHLYAYKTPEQFEQDLVFLKQNYRLLSYADLEAGRADVPNGVLVSFDDGLAECYSVARPLLLRHGVPCIFFVSPRYLDNARMFSFDRASLCIDALEGMEAQRQGSALRAAGGLLGRRFADLPEFARWLTTWIRTLDEEGEVTLDRLCEVAGVDPRAYLEENRPYMTREEVRTLHADGFTIGAHGLRHIALGAFRPEEVEAQIVESCREVALLTGSARLPFAFPFDADGVDRRLLGALRERHPEVGLLFDTRQLRRDEAFMVNRMIVDLPPAAGGSRTNLPAYLRSAYLDEILQKLAPV